MKVLFMRKSFVMRVCKFFKIAYLVSLVMSLIYVFLVVGVEFIFSSPTRYDSLKACGIILIQSALFFLWFKIFANLTIVFGGARFSENEKAILRITGILLGAVFLVNLLDYGISAIFASSIKPVYWSAIKWPRSDLNFMEYSFGLLSMFFKIVHLWKNFLLPSVEGLGALILALVAYIYGTSTDGN